MNTEVGPGGAVVGIDLIDVDQSVWVQLGHFDGTDPEGVEYHEDDIHVVSDPGEEPCLVRTRACEPNRPRASLTPNQDRPSFVAVVTSVAGYGIMSTRTDA